MSTFFLVLGTSLTLIFGAVSWWVGGPRTDAGHIRPESLPLITGLIVSGLLVVIGSGLSDRQNDKEAAKRHSELLVSVFRESQRITPADIRAVLKFHEQKIGIPTPLNDHWIARVNVVAKGGAPPTPGQLYSELRKRDDTIKLQAATHVVRPTEEYVEPEARPSQVSFFTDFFGDLQTHANAREWNGSIVELDVEAYNNGSLLIDWFKAKGIVLEDPHAFVREFGLDPDDAYDDDGFHQGDGDTGVRVTAEIFVGTRSLGEMTGWVLWHSDPPRLDTDSALIQFHPLRIADNYFPDPAPQPDDGMSVTEWILVVVGWLLTLASLTTAAIVVKKLVT